MGRCRLILVVLFALSAFAGCSRRVDDSTLKLALQTEPTTLDPAHSVDF